MISLTQTLARVALAVESGKISLEDGAILCRDLMEVYQDRNDEKLAYKVAALQVKGLLSRHGISAEE